MAKVRGKLLETITFNKILFALCVISLLHKYFTINPITVVRVKEVNLNKSITSSKFKPLSPFWRQNSVTDNYNQLLNITDFKFAINSQPCNDYPEGLLLVIIISSNPVNFEKRMVIRNTWGKNFETTKVVFLIGMVTDNAVAEKIRDESDNYGDIVQGTFVDAYKNMTYKHVMGLKWVANHCANAKYVLKTDDDVFVNTHELRHYLATSLSPWGTRDLIMCPLLAHTPVLRGYSKWTVTKEEYPEDFYPNYCAGWTILYSQDVVRRLLQTAQSLIIPYFWIDDVYITGMVAEKIGIPRSAINEMILNGNNLKKLKASGVHSIPPFLLGPVELPIDRIKEIWEALPDSYELNE